MKKEKTEWNYLVMLYEYEQLGYVFDWRNLDNNDWPKSTHILIQRLLSVVKAYSGRSYDVSSKEGKQEFMFDFRWGLQMKSVACTEDQLLKIKELLGVKEDIFQKIKDNEPNVVSYYEPLFRLYEAEYRYITAFNHVPVEVYNTPFEIVDKFKWIAVDQYIELKTKPVREAMKLLMGKPYERIFTVEELQRDYDYPMETDEQLRQYDIEKMEEERRKDEESENRNVEYQLPQIENPAIAFTEEFIRDNPDIIAQIAEALDVYEDSFVALKDCKDIWARDFMPVQRQDDMYVQYQYKPDYLQNKKDLPYQTDPELVTIAEGNVSDLVVDIKTDLIIDGGNVITGLDMNLKPCVILTEKVLFENKPKTYSEVITELRDLFSAEVLIIPWDREEPYGHADGMVRYLSPGRVLINNFKEVDKKIYNEIKSALVHHFQIEELEYGNLNRTDSWCHLNYIETETDVLIPTCGIASEGIAKVQIEKFTGKRGHLIKMPKIIKQGGALHCVSWELKPINPVENYLLPILTERQWKGAALINYVTCNNVVREFIETLTFTLSSFGKSVSVFSPYEIRTNDKGIKKHYIKGLTADDISLLMPYIKANNSDAVIICGIDYGPKKGKITQEILIEQKRSFVASLKKLSIEVNKPIINVDSYDDYFDMLDKQGYMETDEIIDINKVCDVVGLIERPRTDDYEASCVIIKNDMSQELYSFDLWQIGIQRRKMEEQQRAPF